VKTNTRVSHAALMCILLVTPWPVSGQDCPAWDQVRYSAADTRALAEISLTSITQAQLSQSIKDLKPTKSRHGTAYFAMRTPDTMKASVAGLASPDQILTVTAREPRAGSPTQDPHTQQSRLVWEAP
jgi:hypothetical protein